MKGVNNVSWLLEGDTVGSLATSQLWGFLFNPGNIIYMCEVLHVLPFLRGCPLASPQKNASR